MTAVRRSLVLLALAACGGDDEGGDGGGGDESEVLTSCEASCGAMEDAGCNNTCEGGFCETISVQAEPTDCEEELIQLYDTVAGAEDPCDRSQFEEEQAFAEECIASFCQENPDDPICEFVPSAIPSAP